MGNSSVGDFMIDLTWYTTVLSFVILLLRRILKKKTIFDLLYRKRDQAIQQNIVYNSDLDRIEREFPSLFNKIFDKTLSIIIVIDSTNYSIVNNFTEIVQFFNQISMGQGIKYFTYEFVIVNNNILNSSDIQYLQMQPNVRLITLNKSMGKGTAIQIGSFSTNGRYILYLSLSNPIQSLYKFIRNFKVQINDEYCTFLPVRQNCPQITYLQKYLVYRQYIDKIHDYNFESFIISRKLAQIVLEDIHFSTRNCFNLEFLMILKYYRFKTIEIPIDADYSKPKLSFKDNIKSFFSLIGLITARFLNLYSYSFRQPLKNCSNNESYFSRIELI